MAAVARYLADTSALARLHLPDVAAALKPLIETGLVATCAVVEFEVLWSTRSPSEYEAVQSNRSLGYEWLPTEDTDWERALEVQKQLWATGRMRTVPLPDLLVAAVGERHKVTVLHYDHDYDTITDVTNQPMQWIVPRGSVG
ncbi:MAG: PIN domain nuclease [Acidimicrobiales bacterium]